MRPTVGSLFSGIGGFDLGLERAGWEIAWQVEIDSECQQVLTRHWPDVPRFADVREIHVSTALSKDGRSDLESQQFVLSDAPDVSKSVTVGAQDDAVINGVLPSSRPRGNVVGVAGSKIPPASQAGIAVDSAECLHPTALGRVHGALGNDIGPVLVPGSAAVPADDLCTMRQLSLTRQTGTVPVDEAARATVSILRGNQSTAAASAGDSVHSPNTSLLLPNSITPVDLICAGFPCQDVSVAGKRRGLDGERTGLFWEIIRIVKEMRAVTGGRYPTFVLLENVPGLLSADTGRAFARILSALADAGALDICWTVLDARWFGVAQRRRRLFTLADFGGQRADAILPESESCPGHPPAGREAGPGVAAGAQDGAGGVGYRKATRPHGADDAERWEQDELTGTLNGWEERHDPPPHLVVANTLRAKTTRATWQVEDTFIPIARPLLSSPFGYRSDLETETLVTHTLSAEGADASEDGTGRGTPLVPLMAAGCANSNGAGIGREGDPAMTLDTTGAAAVGNGMAVRRLTPRECERLMGLPDHWTAVGADGKPISDSARYRMLGNSVVTNVVKWIGRRILEALPCP